jgi:hypothetical protein
MHLQTAIESLDGLARSFDNSEKMAHKMAQKAKSEAISEIPSLSD